MEEQIVATTMNVHELSEAIKAKAIELGYVACGFTTTDSFPEYDAELTNREGYDRFKKGNLSGHPDSLNQESGTKSIISLVDSFAEIDFPANMTPFIGRAYLAKLYGGVAPGTNAPKHAAMRDYLHSLGITTFDMAGFMQVPDRAVAARAGLVTYGKNNFAYCSNHGSLIIITNILVDAVLETDVYPIKRPCPPDCRLCIDACPTHAMDDEGRLNPTRCILYNNMFPDAILDVSVRDDLGIHIHGCDECQAACPRNKQAFFGENKTPDPLLEEVAPDFSLENILLGGEEFFNKTTGRIISPYFKEYARHQRNAAIAMGNSGDAAYLPALQRALEACELNETDTAAEFGDLHAAILWAIEKLQAR